MQWKEKVFMNDNKVKIISACKSNYEGMIALVDSENKVYLGKRENYHRASEENEEFSYYDNQDNSLCFISNNVKIFNFLYSSGWALSQEEMLQYFTMELYEEFDKLQNGILKQFKRNQEIMFKENSFISPNELLCEIAKRREEKIKRDKQCDDIDNISEEDPEEAL